MKCSEYNTVWTASEFTVALADRHRMGRVCLTSHTCPLRMNDASALLVLLLLSSPMMCDARLICVGTAGL